MKPLLVKIQRDIPYPVLLAAAWCLSLIVIAAGLNVLGGWIGQLTAVIIPLAIALLLAALLEPLNNFLHHKARFPRTLSSLASISLCAGIVAAAFTISVQRLTSDFQQLVSGASTGLGMINQWLRTGPLKLRLPNNNELLDRLQSLGQGGTDSPIFSGVMKVGTTTIDVVAGSLICFIATFFFLHQGNRIWRFMLNFVPKANRRRTHEAARRGWVSLGSYTRAQLGVAGINAVGIGIGAWLMGLPLVIPIVVIVYLFSFVPIIGAWLSGFIAMLIAFVDKGPWMAVVMVLVVLLVHLIELHVLQPFLMGHAVSVHPLAVIVVVAAGTYLFGLAGALFAVPLVATLNSSVRYLVGQDPFPELGTDASLSDDI